MRDWEVEWECTATVFASVVAPDEETARQIAETGHGVELENVSELRDWKVVKVTPFVRREEDE